MKNEAKIINGCLKGKQSAYKDLYELYKDYCFTICIRYGIPQSEVKDALQIIFTQIFASLKKYDSQKSKFKTWLTRVTINQILNQKRKHRISYQSLDGTNAEVLEIESSITVEASIDYETIQHILSKMPEQYIVVFNLYIIDGYSHKEIAEQLDISEGTSRVLLYRGRKWAMKKLHFFKKNTKQLISNVL